MFIYIMIWDNKTLIYMHNNSVAVGSVTLGIGCINIMT